jgi:hypothetical protein
MRRSSPNGTSVCGFAATQSAFGTDGCRVRAGDAGPVNADIFIFLALQAAAVVGILAVALTAFAFREDPEQ